jgi:hypothetical protein
MLKFAVVPQEVALSRQKMAFQAYAGRGKMSFAELETASGVPERSLQGYSSGQNQMPLYAVMSVMAVLPVGFGQILLAPSGKNVVEGDEAVTGTLALNVTVHKLAEMIARHIADGRIDHREEASEAPLVRELFAACGEWMNGRENKFVSKSPPPPPKK